MKTRRFTFYFSAILFSFFAAHTVHSQEWGVLNSGINEPVNDLGFLDENAGVAIGDAGRIVGTLDGGDNWNLIPSGTVENLNSISSPDPGVWVICGDNGTILRSVNSGVTWTPVTSGVLTNLNTVSFFDADNGMIAGDAGTILTTIDGGVSWTAQNSTTTNNLSGSSYTVSGNMFVVGEGLTDATVLVSYNSGVNWSAQTSGTLNSLNQVVFTDDNNGFAVGQLGTLLNTTDGGTTWGASAISIADLSDVTFVNDSVGFVVGTAGNILKTEDAGVSWAALTSNSTEELYSVQMINSLSGYATGNNGTILRTCPTPAFMSSMGDSICQGTTVDFINESSASEDFLWLVDGDTLGTSTDFNYTFTTNGSYDVVLIASNPACENQVSQTITVNAIPFVDLGNDTTICSTCSDTLVAPSGYSYQWYYNGTFNGNISEVNIASVAGEYIVEVTNAEGCVGSDTINIMMTNSLLESALGKIEVMVYPNPSSGIYTIDLAGESKTVQFSVVDILGAVVSQGTFDGGKNTIDLTRLDTGVYHLMLNDSQSSATIRLLKE